MHRTFEPCGSHPALSVFGVNDDSPRKVEDLPHERKLVRPRLPKRRVESGESPLRRDTAFDASFAFDRSEISVPVSPAEGQTGNEPVQGDLVQDEKARPTA